MKTLILFIIFSLYSICGYSYLSYEKTEYKYEDGLPQKTITSISKDKNGIIWFSTWNGLCNYDGQHFNSFRIQPGDSNELMTNRIDNIKFDSNNNMWILDDKRYIYYFSKNKGTFHSTNIQTASVKSIFTLSNGEIWILQSDSRLIRMKYERNCIIFQDIFTAEHSINNIHDIIIRNNLTWIITNKGIFRFCNNTRNTTFIKIGNHRDVICSMRKLGNEKLLLGTECGNLLLYNFKANSFIRLNNISNKKITRIKAFVADSYLLFSENNGFHIFDSRKSITIHISSNNLLLSNNVSSIYCDNNDNIWVLYYNINKITRIDSKLNSSIHYNLKMQYKENLHRSINEDKNGVLWIFSKEGILNYFDCKKKDFEPFLFDESITGTSEVKKIYMDDQGNLWIIKNPNGLIKITFKNSAFSILSNRDKINSNNIVKSIIEDSDKNIWVGTYNGELQVYDSHKNFKGYIDINGRLSNTPYRFDAIYALFQDSKKNIWIGTRNDGLIKLTPNGKYRYYIKRYNYSSSNLYGLNNNQIFSINEDHKGNVLIGTLKGGLNYINTDYDDNNIFINCNNYLKDYPLKFVNIKDIMVDDNNNIWLATSSGILLCRWHKDRLKYIPITRDSERSNSLGCNNVYDIFNSKSGKIYVATFGGGIDKFEGFDKNGISLFMNYDPNRNISDIPFSITEDQIGNLWIPSEDGLFKYTVNKDSFEKFDYRFLPHNTSFIESKAICRKNGEILIPSNNGVICFNPLNIKRNEYKPKTFISSLIVNGGKEKEIIESEDIKLKYNENSFKITFNNLDMRFSDKIEYAYRLKNFDDWNYVGNDHAAIYTNIPKGEYVFQVKSTNSDGVWNSETKELNICILPSFWQSIYGRIIIVWLILFIIYIILFVIRRIDTLKNKILIEKHIQQIKTKFFTDIIHELRTPFTLILAPTEHILTNKKIPSYMEQDIKLIRNNTMRTLNIINQVLNLQKMQNSDIKLRVKRIDIIAFISKIIADFKALAIQRDTDLILVHESKESYIWADADKFESIMFNLISNAFKYSTKGTIIKITINEDQDNVIIKITDQGCGIKPERLETIFNRFESYVRSDIFKNPNTGIGLSLVKEYVNIHKGKIDVQSIDNEGTTFIITFMKGNAHFESNTEFVVDDYDNDREEETLSIKCTDTDIHNNIEEDKTSILIVEDNIGLCNFLKSTLEIKYKVLIANNGREGYEKIIKFMPSIIISDIVMPVMDGLKMVQKVRNNQECSHIPIILLSTKEDIDSKMHGMDMGIEDYITKPFSSSFLISRISNILRRREELQRLYYTMVLKDRDNHDQNSKESESLNFVSKSDNEFINRVIDFIKINYGNSDFTPDNIINEIGISRSALFKKLKNLIGLTPMELIRDIRLNAALNLLKEDISISEIEFMTGFNDSNYFSKCFKSMYGKTPTEYKNGLL